MNRIGMSCAVAVIVCHAIGHVAFVHGQEEPTQVVIKRNAIHLLNPDDYRAPLSLTAINQVQIRARVEGVVQNVRPTPGMKVSLQEELIKIDSAQAAKLLERARANVKLTTLRRDMMKADVQTGKQTQNMLELAEAELSVAEADLELAKLNFEHTSIRAPFAGEVTRLPVAQGSFVNLGDVLVELRDTSRLTAQLPVDRTQVKVGDTITLQVDQSTTQAKVQVILPLDEKWQSLRELIETAALAVVVVDNTGGTFQDGQTVHSAIVPRQPIAEVPNTSLRNSEAGTRLIQVIRDSMVRDIEVKLLGPVGEGRSYVSGPLQAEDELITESSFPLRDGTMVRPRALDPPSPAPGTTPRATTPTPGGTPAPVPQPGGNPGF
ncbi:MAG: efflux RND transporter periplasmic adaptor subunit [Planctomycetaceae bacterium]|nr:efflux RND transporter periplasmic adaptor subunit [Planctomycetaceae bacterium]